MKHVVSALAVVLFVLPAIALAQDSKAVSFEDAGKAFYSGRTVEAIEAIENKLPNLTEPSAKLTSELDLLYMCSSSENFECFEEALLRYGDTLELIDNVEDGDFLKDHFTHQILGWWVYHSWWNGQYDEAENFASYANGRPFYVFEPLNYKALQVAQSRSAYLKRDYFLARKSISKLVNYQVLVSQNSNMANSYLTALYLYEIILLHYFLGDNSSAMRMVIQFDEFINRHLPNESVEYLRYLTQSARVIGTTNDFKARALAAERLQNAYSGIARTQLEEYTKQFHLVTVAAELTAIAILGENVVQAQKMHQHSPLQGCPSSGILGQTAA